MLSPSVHRSFMLLTSFYFYDAARFTHGVASGDPLADRVILWTRVLPAEGTSTSVTWEVANDNAFTTIISRGTSTTDASCDYTVKVDAGGSQAGATYFYRFKVGATLSPVGRTRTLPTGTVNEIKLAVFSCANYPAGYFHAYAEATKRDDLFAAVHLGDYIYEYGAGADQYASVDAAKLGRVSVPANELLKLDDYRQRYAQYRSDKDLQALHAKLPFICIWDDHEIANDTWKEGAENHTPANEGDFALRRAAAVKAWREWLPVREDSNPLRIYRSFQFGNLLSLHMLETRNLARDKPLDYADFMDATTGTFDATRFAAAMADPTRQLLGTEQTAWLQGQAVDPDLSLCRYRTARLHGRNLYSNGSQSRLVLCVECENQHLYQQTGQELAHFAGGCQSTHYTGGLMRCLPATTQCAGKVF